MGLRGKYEEGSYAMGLFSKDIKSMDDLYLHVAGRLLRREPDREVTAKADR